MHPSRIMYLMHSETVSRDAHLCKSIRQLREKVVQEQDLILFDEAALCLANGAYRAAYIVVWITIAESIRGKFKVMALRDDEIQRLVRKIEDMEIQEKPTDMVLLNSALKFGFVNKDEHLKLGQIRTLRGVYAHPLGSAPKPEEVLAALVVAVDTILSKPPMLRFGYADQLVSALFGDRHYLEDIPEKVQTFAGTALPRIHFEVWPYLLRSIASRLEATIDDPDMALFSRRGLEFAKAFFERAEPDLKAEEWNLLRLIQDYPTAMSLILSHPPLWLRLADQAQDMVIGHLLEPVINGVVCLPTAQGLGYVRVLRDKNLLSQFHVSHFLRAVASASYTAVVEAGIPLSEYAQRIIDDLRSHTWSTQNLAADALALVGPEQCAHLSSEIQETLGRNILQAADGESHSAGRLLVSLGEKKNEWPESFVKGVLFETLVNEGGELRFKKRCFAKALAAALALPDEESCTIIGEAAKVVKKSKPKCGWIAENDSEEIQDAISRARLVTTTKEQRQVLAKLSTAIKSTTTKFGDLSF